MKLIIALVLMILLAACGGGSVFNPLDNDLKGVKGEEPDTVRVFYNADKFPNLNIVCVDGVGFSTHSFGVSGDQTGAPSSPGFRELSEGATAKLCKPTDTEVVPDSG